MTELLLQFIFNFLIPLLIKTAIIWIPIVSFFAVKKFWYENLEKEALDKMDWVMLEIKVPKDVFKTPQAMEMIFAGLEQGTPESDWFKKWWKGEFVAAYSSLEIVSIEGNVYFFIRTQKKHRDTIESLIYSQYPNAEVSSVDDYTRYVPQWKPDNGWVLDASEFHLTKDDPIPIKTYIDYGLDSKSNSMDEEQKIDPITPLIEILGSIGKNEQIWIQVIVRQATKRWKNSKGEDLEWVKQGRDFVDSLIKEYSNVTIGEGEKEKKVGGYKNLSPADQEVVDAVERSMQKTGFDTGIRAIYIAKKENDKKRMGSIKTAFKLYNAPHLNSFKAVGAGFKYPWEDWSNMRKNDNLKKLFKQYINRSFFYEGLSKKKKIFILNSEELATIFHFPGRVSTTGSFERIAALKAEPPANLPI
jgi:hypothetical protein